MKQQLLDTWRIHNSMNLLLLDHITAAGLNATLSRRGGRTVSQQFIHIHKVRMTWLEVTAPELFKKYSKLDPKTNPDHRVMRKALEDSATAITLFIEQCWENGGKVKSFKSGLIPFVGYLISHESHHRGNILLTLKQSGEKIPDAVNWELWEWQK